MSLGTSQKIVLAGRTFVRAGESTVEHDIEFMRLLSAAGLSGGTLRVAAENDEQFAWRLLELLIEAGALLPLVACMIVPESAAPRRPGMIAGALERMGFVRREASRGGWTRELQAETVAFLKTLDEPRDKEQVYKLVGELLLPFLVGVLASWTSSPRSSSSGPSTPPDTGANDLNAAATSAHGES